MSNVETYFLIAVNGDGTFTSYSQLPEEPIQAARVATNYEVYQTCKQIAEEFETQILVDRITKSVVNTLMPPQPTVADAVKDKLKERNINPESPVSDQ
jgi:Icc-related predicted phosphoesterase